jgi:selenocysteine lyase/cysteine desulfurase
MTGMLFASHPETVDAEITRYRRALDRDPAGVGRLSGPGETEVREAAGRYMGVESADVGLTTSTTMGLAILYHGFKLGPGHEILYTTHDHTATNTSIRYKAEMSGATVRQVALYDEMQPDLADPSQMIERLRDAIRPETRVFGTTWVHSNNGLKIPIAELSKVIAEANRARDEDDQISFVVDGVHGFGIENVGMAELGCDFFSAGTHKWIFGPRGTGVVWGRPEAQDRVFPIIPSFTRGGWGGRMSPGGFNAYDHRLAVGKAFDFHMTLDKARVQARIHELNTMLKEGLAAMDQVRLYTPVDARLSSGITCFNIEGVQRGEVVRRLRDEHRIIASTSWGRPGGVRLTPGLLNNEDEVEVCLEAVRALAG